MLKVLRKASSTDGLLISDYVTLFFSLPLDHRCSSSSLYQTKKSSPQSHQHQSRQSSLPISTIVLDSPISKFISWTINLREQIELQLQIHHIIIKITIHSNSNYITYELKL
jgi:hypothetical protein